ncbi:hypothetical protein ES702_05101 [subsurface metagenome]
MNGWDAIKWVRVELSEATSQAKSGSKTTAAACLGHARRLLEKYCKEERGPDHGFADQPNPGKRKV